MQIPRKPAVRYRDGPAGEVSGVKDTARPGTRPFAEFNTVIPKLLNQGNASFLGHLL